MSERESGFNMPAGSYEADIPGFSADDEGDALDYEAAMEAALEREFSDADREED